MSADLAAEFLLPVFRIMALCASLAGLVLGACLLLFPERTLARLRHMNRWVSSRRAIKPLEVQRTALQETRGRRLWLGLVLAAVGAYALIVLVWNVDPGRVAAALAADPKYSPTAVVVESGRWILVAGSTVCIAIGLMMAFAPRAMESFEAWSNRWVSSRRALQGADTMYVPFDRLAERFPRGFAILILALSAAACASSVVLLLQR
jgi:hypothetical protein